MWEGVQIFFDRGDLLSVREASKFHEDVRVVRTWLDSCAVAVGACVLAPGIGPFDVWSPSPSGSDTSKWLQKEACTGDRSLLRGRAILL